MRPYPTIILKGWWLILLVLLAAAVVLGRHVPDLEVRAGTSVLLDEDDPDLAFYNRTRPLWGYDEYAIACVTRDDWFTPEGTQLLERFVADLEQADHVDHVASILDVPLLRQQPGPAFNPLAVPTLRSADLDYARARDEIVEHTLARRNLISEDGRSVAVLAYLDVPQDIRELTPLGSSLSVERGTDPDAARRVEETQSRLKAATDVLTRRRLDMVASIRERVKRWAPDLREPVRLSGTTILNADIMDYLQHDLRVFGLAALLLFTLAFALVYRTWRFVLLPIVTCLLPVVLILGAMSLLDMQLTLITANLPVLLFTLMLPYTVYFVERYRERRALFPAEPGGVSTAEAARRIWVPCLFSCLTTMAGFAALTTSGTRPVHDFGLMMAAGMGVGLGVVFLAIPCMSRPLPALVVAPDAARTEPTKLTKLFARMALGRPAWVVAGGVLLMAVSFWGATRLSAQSKVTEYFKHDSEVYKGLETIDRRLGGTTPLEIQLTSTKPNNFVKPEGLAQLEAVGHYFDHVPETGSVRSLATLVEELKKKNPEIVPLLPLLARHPKVRSFTRELANEDYSIARVLVRLRETAPTLDRDVILDGLREHLAEQSELEGLDVRVTGVFLLYANMLNTLVRTQRDTFLFVVLAIYVMLVVLFRAPLLALLVLLTQVLPATVMLGIMGWLAIPLDLVTVMIASIAMGVGIDAAIQYTFRYRTELAVDGDRRAALLRAHATIGRAIWIATSVIVVGFCVLMLSDFRPSIYFGLFTAVAMLMSQLAALTILPSIFLLTHLPRLPKRAGTGTATVR